MDHILKKIFFLTFISTFLFGCTSKTNTVDIDLSNLPKPKKIKISDSVGKDIDNAGNQSFIKDLIPYESQKNLLSNFKFGKKDPFSRNETQNNLLGSTFMLKGFLNTEIEKYVFVSYLGKEGAISENSIGGQNTNLLPNGAKVIYINTKKKQLKISFDNEDFIFEL